MHTSYIPSRILWLRKNNIEHFNRVELWTDFSNYLLRRWMESKGIPLSYSVASWTGMDTLPQICGMRQAGQTAQRVACHKFVACGWLAGQARASLLSAQAGLLILTSTKWRQTKQQLAQLRSQCISRASPGNCPSWFSPAPEGPSLDESRLRCL